MYVAVQRMNLRLHCDPTTQGYVGRSVIRISTVAPHTSLQARCSRWSRWIGGNRFSRSRRANPQSHPSRASGASGVNRHQRMYPQPKGNGSFGCAGIGTIGARALSKGSGPRICRWAIGCGNGRGGLLKPSRFRRTSGSMRLRSPQRGRQQRFRWMGG